MRLFNSFKSFQSLSWIELIPILATGYTAVWIIACNFNSPLQLAQGYVCPAALTTVLGGWRYTSRGTGGQCAIMAGTFLMPRWCAESWAVALHSPHQSRGSGSGVGAGTGTWTVEVVQFSWMDLRALEMKHPFMTAPGPLHLPGGGVQSIFLPLLFALVSTVMSVKWQFAECKKMCALLMILFELRLIYNNA